MIEIPNSVASELKARKVRHETRAYEIPFETIRAVSPINPRIAFLMSRTRGKIKDLEWLGGKRLSNPIWRISVGFEMDEGCRRMKALRSGRGENAGVRNRSRN